MDYIPTTFFYNIKDRICLSNSLNFYLDNPRTDEEISNVKILLQEAIESYGPLRFLKAEPNNDASIFKFLNTYNAITSEKDRFIDISNIGTFDEALNVLAKSWIILRYDEESPLKFPEHTLLNRN
jgi:hypothetical protein